MDVKLVSTGIPYLDRDVIREFSTLKFMSIDRQVVKMNPTILAALNCSLVKSLSDDYEDCCVITEFSRADLEEINEFTLTGQCKQSRAFQALGIELKTLFNHTSNASNQVVECKVEVKDEVVEDHNDKYHDLDDTFNDSFFDDFDVIEEDDDDDDDFDFGDVITKQKKKRGRKPKKEKGSPVSKKPRGANASVAPLTPEQQMLYENYQLPRPLETFKVPAFESKTKTTSTEIDFTKPLACPVCSSRFTCNQNLQSHLIKLHSEHYNCYFCKKAFALNQVEDLRLHMFKHEHKILSTCAKTCIQCGMYFRQSYKHQDHLKKKGPNHNDQCAQCPETFLSYEDHKLHVEKVHYGKWKLKCGFCSDKFDEECDLKSHHLAYHVQKPTLLNAKNGQTEPKKKYVPAKKVCEECGSHVSNLKVHMIGVHGVAKYICSQCPLTFKTTDSLKRHVEWVHVKVPCSECGEMVGRRKMSRHIASKHTSIYDRKFKCDVCGKGFNDKAKLSDHKNVHTGEKPFKCKFCNACFASRGTHAMHERSHLGHRRSK